MIKCGRYLTHLIITDDHHQYSWMCDVLKNNFPNITHFSIDLENITDGYNISNEDLVEIIMSMKKLKYFKIVLKGAPRMSPIIKFSDVLEILPNDMKEIHLTGACINHFSSTDPEHYFRDSPVSIFL